MKSLGAKISIYAGIVVLILSVGFGFFAYHYGSSAVLAEVEQALIMQAEEAGRYVESRFEVHLSILEAISNQAGIQGMQWELQKYMLRAEVERGAQFLGFGVVDLEGVARYIDETTDNLKEQDYVIKALEGNPVVANLTVDEVSGEAVLVFAVPIKRDEQVLGVLLGKRDGLTLSEITDRLGFGASGMGFILGADGVAYAHPERAYVSNQTNLLATYSEPDQLGNAIQELGFGNTGIIRYNKDGVIHLAGLAPIPSTDWVIGIGALENEVLENINGFQKLTVVIALVLVLLGFVAALIIARQISNPLRKVQETIEVVAEGDLTKSVDVKAKDEVGRVASALNTTIESMRGVISLLADTTGELGGTSEQMAATSEQVSASIEEIASTTNQFSSALDLMNRNAQTMSRNVQEISDKATRGETAVKGIVEEMGQLRDNTEKLARDISNLGTLSNQIGQIVDVINDIAEQTNLLALNAAIEAARAGEHGRGFAVVADEVRKLAEESSHATTEIETLISQIQSGIAHAVNDMNLGAKQTADALISVGDSGEILQGILSEVEGIVGAVQQITTGLEEANSSGQEIAGATEEQAASIGAIAAFAQKLSDLGVKLQELVSHFKIA